MRVGNLGGFFGPSIMGTLRDVTGGYTGGLLVLAGSLVLEAILVVCLRLPAETKTVVSDVRVPGVRLRELRFCKVVTGELSGQTWV